MSRELNSFTDVAAFLQNWISGKAAQIRQKKITAQMSVPTTVIEVNKCTVELESSNTLASFTVWGTGEYQIIFVDSGSMTEYFSEDGACVNLQELSAALDKQFDEFIKSLKT